MSIFPRFLHEAFAKMFNKTLEAEGQGDLKYVIPEDAEYGTMVEAGPVPRMPLSKQHIGVDPASGRDVGKGMVVVEQAYLAHAGEMVEVHGRLKEAWREICERMFDRLELDYEDFFTIGEKYGLLREEVFDPAIHGEHFDGYPGDPIYFNALQEVKSATANDKD